MFRSQQAARGSLALRRGNSPSARSPLVTGLPPWSLLSGCGAPDCAPLPAQGLCPLPVLPMTASARQVVSGVSLGMGGAQGEYCPCGCAGRRLRCVTGTPGTLLTEAAAQHRVSEEDVSAQQR